MKHILKKYLFEDVYKDINLHQNNQFEFVPVDNLDKSTLARASKSNFVILQTSDSSNLHAFIYNHSGKHITIPMPDLTLVYYDFAYKLNVRRKELSKEMLHKLGDVKTFSETNSDLLYNFYGYSSSCIINLFTTLESFINSLLPVNKNYEQKLKNRTEVYNRDQIQLTFSFYDKINKVLPYFYEGKDYFKKATPKNQHIKNLKELRDMIIHTKSDDNGKSQIEIFKKILNFKYDDTFLAVRDFINFYTNNYVIDCPCNEDF
ncbi:hypothetical protein [Paenimyroides baculatum]|uniref:RiboL-PSP-HEPN domain-containing protein n=1 Tax=Paenimyroides baculatum TaxID=2608000 RepID=A0A5M6CGA4_9FLAO|nr:hypothetical protein [Paenimyroides baculatum]KAA5533973.1 hypothetical protein F0460_11610 [Paenimyroides baculatum]